MSNTCKSQKKRLLLHHQTKRKIMKTQITNEQQEQLIALDIIHGEQNGYTFGFALMLEKRGIEATKIVSAIVDYVKPNRSLRVQLFGVHHNLTH